MKTKPDVSSRVTAAVKDGTLEITIYGDIGESWWDDKGITPKSVKQEMDDAGDYDKLSVRINSPGGNAFDGVAIYNVLRAPKKPVAVIVDGIAASAASIIAMAGDTVTMGTGSMMMLHNPWTFAMGNAADLRAQADVLDQIADSMADIYVARSGKTKKEVRDILDAETWLSAQEAVDEGFATEVAETPESAKALAMAKSFPLLSKLRNVPEELKAKAEVPPPPKQVESAPPANSTKAAQSGPPAENLTVVRERFELERLLT